MEININDMIEEYTSQPFMILPAHYRKHPVGFVEPGYMTNISAFLFPVQGEGYFKLDGQPFQFRPGMVIHGCPGKWLTSGNITDKPLHFYIMYYHHNRETSGYMHRAFEMEIGSNPNMIALLKMLVKASDKPDNYSKFQAKTLVYSILSEVFSAAKSIKKTETHAIVEEARGYIEFHYMRQHTLCDLASRYGMCPKYFSEVFKKYTGISPIDYLIGYRMKQSYKLFLSTSCSVKEIAESVGYQDAYYFSRLFKKQFGIAPSQVRCRVMEQAN
ncbi:MAG: AraC family transcriptional regulator [Paenibacillaceae bacterium]|nr:AraC family transcriptional regulator [Paenibacillaceae bacterium]